MARLGDLLDIQNGFAFSSGQFVATAEGVPLIRIRDLGKKTTEVGYRGVYRDEFLVNQGDLLIGMDGDFECHRWEGPQALLNQRVCRLCNFSSELDRSYLFHWIGKALQEIHGKTSFVTVKHISSKQIANLDIILPPLDEQRRIVGLLDRAAEIRRRADAARAKARAIIPALFLDMFGDPATNPKGWAVRPLAEVADIGSGLTKGRKLNGTPAEPTPYLRVANVQADRLDLSEIKMIDATDDDRVRCRLLPGDLLMTEGGDLDKLGRCAMWQGEVELCLHQNHIFRVRMGSAIVPDYARAFMQSEAARGYFLRVAKRTTGIASINKTQLGRLPVWVPPLPLQTSFAEQARRIETTARALDVAAAKAEAMAAALSHDIFG
ncbi:restriction endonuclease subunit S [Xanthobacter sp. V7C-4]|uniref:restriction endonuclease subunit S n=1 Tax=Xanthobacter autotrophicus (strain ATCC BAA-1158 / Py2) TaxID=78245 RepID=UPI00372B89F6